MRAIIRDGRPPSSAARACASWSWTAAARSAIIVHERRDRPEDQGGVRVRLGEERRRPRKPEKSIEDLDLVAGYFRRVDDAGVDDRSRADDGVERQVVAVDFHQHERLVGVVAERRQRRALAQVARAQLARRALDEVRDPVLRLDPLVGVIVAGEDQADAVL